MRRPLVSLCLALLITACGGDEGSDGPDPATDVCDRLSLEDASRIVGVDYTVNGQARDLCIYQRRGTDQAFSLRLIAYTDGYDEVVADAESIGYTSSRIRVAGADRAVALTGTLRSVVAEQDGKAYEVSFNGDAATAGRLMAVVLGGSDTGAGPRPVASPCDDLSRADVRRLLGVPAKPKVGAEEVALKACTWRGQGRELVVATGRGRGPVAEFWDENFFVGKGVQPERLRVPGADDALSVTSKSGDGVGLAVARGDLSFVVTVSGGLPDAGATVLKAATLLIGAA